MTRYIILLIVAISLSSCVSQQNKIARASMLLRDNHSQLATLCAEQFPIKERFIVGKEIVKTDTLITSVRRVSCPPVLGQKTAFIRCPSGQIVTKTITKTDTIERENTARITHLNDKILRAQYLLSQEIENHNSLKKRFNTYSWMSMGSMFLLCLPFFLKIILRWIR